MLILHCWVMHVCWTKPLKKGPNILYMICTEIVNMFTYQCPPYRNPWCDLRIAAEVVMWNSSPRCDCSKCDSCTSFYGLSSTVNASSTFLRITLSHLAKECQLICWLINLTGLIRTVSCLFFCFVWPAYAEIKCSGNAVCARESICSEACCDRAQDPVFHRRPVSHNVCTAAGLIKAPHNTVSWVMCSTPGLRAGGQICRSSLGASFLSLFLVFFFLGHWSINHTGDTALLGQCLLYCSTLTQLKLIVLYF